MSDPEQCIICLDSLPSLTVAAATAAATGDGAPAADHVPSVNAILENCEPINTTTARADDDETNILNIVAALDGCDHVIHDVCIRSWAQKTNTCPICRNEFHHVRVYNGVDGTAVSTYEVQDKKQVAEFDAQQWMRDNLGEEARENFEEWLDTEENPCPVCNTAGREDVLLLCDGCEAAYHTHCIGLSSVPEGQWFCMECAELYEVSAMPRAIAAQIFESHPIRRDGRAQQVRTVADHRRARRRARNEEWQGAWEQFAGRFYDLSQLDLDNVDDEDEEYRQFRRYQQIDRRELARWQQRVNIAARLGAQRQFTDNIPPQISEQLQPAPEPVIETRDERRAWAALERTRDDEVAPINTRKRKARSATASPAEPAPEPERKLKRPRTRRRPTLIEGPAAPSSEPVAGPSSAPVPIPVPASAPAPASSPTTNGVTRPSDPPRQEDTPALVSALLKELEPQMLSEGLSWANRGNRAADASSPALSPAGSPAGSPALSPSPSVHGSPRALSLTPPPIPFINGRPGSPTLSLSTHIEPRYPPANYSPTRNGSDQGSDSDSRPLRIARRLDRGGSPKKREPKAGEGRPLELRQPQPRRPRVLHSRAEEKAPMRFVMSPEEKKKINEIVTMALKPHWKGQKLTTEQYSNINRDISRKLYDEVKNASSLDDESRRSWESRAKHEVAQAIAGLSA